MDEEEKKQLEEFDNAIKQKEMVLERADHEVKDDIKNGDLPKSALLIEPLHTFGVPTGVLQRGSIAAHETLMMLTGSNEEIANYYRNYDQNIKSQNSAVASVVKAVDRKQEATFSAEADLESSKIKKKLYEEQLRKAREREAKAKTLSSPSGTSGELADYLIFDDK